MDKSRFPFVAFCVLLVATDLAQASSIRASVHSSVNKLDRKPTAICRKNEPCKYQKITGQNPLRVENVATWCVCQQPEKCVGSRLDLQTKVREFTCRLATKKRVQKRGLFKKRFTVR